MLNTWIKDNAWNLIVTGVAFIMAWSILSSRVSANELHVAQLSSKIDTLQTLVERVIILEERESNIETDIVEIKTDIKEIKKTLNGY